jgi:ABC-type transport system substrate-binding protein
MADKLHVKGKLEQLENRDFQKFLAQLSDPASRPRPEALPHLLLLEWVADYPDPHSFMNIFTSSSENNYMGWKNAEYDQWVEKAVSTADEASRKRYYLEAQKLLLEDEAVLMPLFLNGHQALVRSNLRGVHLNVLDKWYFQNVEFTDSAWSGFGGVGSRMLRRLRVSGGALPGSS